MARPAAMGYFELLPGPSLRQCCSWTRCPPPQGDFALWPHARGGRRVLTAQGAVCRGGSCYSENALCSVNATAPGWAWATSPGVATAPLCPLVLPKTQPARRHPVRRHPVPHRRPSPRPSASLPCPHPVPAASWPPSFAAFPPCPL
uniref:Uncharacterized protein n=1 Tax=Rousettus aegyptiacus TaxID=9407 RepID=A0A7J8IM10_ROUAE|nr:hypothetical protein HJG63_010504 [Rousettus aegyptiacus]